MKKSRLLLAGMLSFALLFGACGGEEKPAENNESTEAETQDDSEVKAVKKAYAVDMANSVVKWKGYIAGIKEHTGTLDLKDAKVSMMGDKISGGSFEVDMMSMETTDSNYTEEGPSSALIGHLQSPEFFDAANHPTAKFTITGSTSDTSVKGNLEIRGITKPAMVEDIEITEEDGRKVVIGNMVFDRQEFDVAYTGAKDFIISDDVELGIKLSLK